MRVRKLFPIFFFAYLVLTSTVLAATFTVFSGQVNADKINVRVDATVGSAVACSLEKGALVEVVAEAYDWYKIRLPKEAAAYVKKDLVECINLEPTSATANIPAKCLNAKVIKDRINVRQGPSETTWILGKADKLTVINILGQDGDWYKIQPIYQSYGWVNKKFVNKEILLPKKETLSLPVKDVEPIKQLILEGTISPYGIVLWRKATHKLITPDNKIYLLKGNRKGLDSLNHQKVKVTGKLITPPESNHPVVEIDIIEALN